MVVGCWSRWHRLPEDVNILECFELPGEEGGLQYWSRKLSSKLTPRKFPYTTFPVVTAL